MATLGAELGCERYLASTVVTGSGQRSSTFLAEFCLSTVLVLALRAFHCRPRRKKRARCTVRVMSSIVDAPRARRERPRGRTAEQRHELTAFQLIELHPVPCQPGPNCRISNWQWSVRGYGGDAGGASIVRMRSFAATHQVRFSALYGLAPE